MPDYYSYVSVKHGRDWSPTHRKHPTRKPGATLCGTLLWKGNDGGSIITKTDNHDDEMVGCAGCRVILGLGPR